MAPARRRSRAHLTRAGCWVTLWLTLVPTATAQAPDLLFVGNHDYPPLSALINGVPTGMDVDMARAIGKVMGRGVRVELMEWAEARDRVLRGEADGLIDLGTSS